jgi:hypothetical protein
MASSPREKLGLRWAGNQAALSYLSPPKSWLRLRIDRYRNCQGQQRGRGEFPVDEADMMASQVSYLATVFSFHSRELEPPQPPVPHPPIPGHRGSLLGPRVTRAFVSLALVPSASITVN